VYARIGAGSIAYPFGIVAPPSLKRSEHSRFSARALFRFSMPQHLFWHCSLLQKQIFWYKRAFVRAIAITKHSSLLTFLLCQNRCGGMLFPSCAAMRRRAF